MSDKQKQLERLVKLADLMEQHADDPQFLKELSKEYKAISKDLFPKKKSEHAWTSRQIKESREEALTTIKNILDKGEIKEQFEDYYSKDKFLVSWKVNHNGFPHEISIDLVDAFYYSYSGSKCIKVRRSLFSEKQLEAYGNIEYALIKEGLKLCTTKEKQQFFDKYAKPYNDGIKRNN